MENLINGQQGVQIENSLSLQTSLSGTHQRLPQRRAKPNVIFPSPPMGKRPLPLTRKSCAKRRKITKQLTKEQRKRRTMKRPRDRRNGHITSKQTIKEWMNERFFFTSTSAPSTRIRIFLNPQLFLSGYGLRPHASGKFGSESRYFLIRSPEWKK